MKNWNEILKELRTDNDRSQKEVAEFLGIQQMQYSRYETGIRDLPLRHLRSLCEYYGVSADYILGLPDSLAWPRRPQEKV